MADLQKIVDDLSKLMVIEADELTSGSAVPLPTAAFIIGQILSIDPTADSKPLTIGPTRPSNTLLICWPPLDPAVTAGHADPLTAASALVPHSWFELI